MQYVVFGADGYIGSYIYGQLKKDGFCAVGTTRRQSETKCDLIYYDIQKRDINQILPTVCETEKVAIICIAESNIDRCYENYGYAYEINVNATKRLIHQLSENDFYIIYFSSDNVFNGESGNYTEESLRCPVNKYGMMKAEMEQYLLEKIPKVCILRISKVLSTYRTKQNAFTEWEEGVNEGKVWCIRGNRLNFVCIDDVYRACLLAAENRLTGLYDVVGDETYSRAELAEMFYEKMNVKMNICECDVGDFPFKDNRPLNLSMCNQKFKNETGYQFTNINDVIEKFIHDERK